MFYIYKVTNKTNGKVYIGQTSQTVARRWKGHVTEACGQQQRDLYFYRAIRKYGPDGFSVEELDSTVDHPTANSLERFYIGLFESNKREFGYNSTIGGQGTVGLSEEAKAKLRISVWDNPEWKKKQSERMKGDKCNLWGKPSANRKDVSDDLLEDLYVNQNKGLVDIEEMVGLHQCAVRLRLQKRGVVFRKQGERIKPQGINLNCFRQDVDDVEIRSLYLEGMSCAKISELLDCSRATIENRVKKMALPSTRIANPEIRKRLFRETLESAELEPFY